MPMNRGSSNPRTALLLAASPLAIYLGIGAVRKAAAFMAGPVGKALLPLALDVAVRHFMPGEVGGQQRCPGKVCPIVASMEEAAADEHNTEGGES